MKQAKEILLDGTYLGRTVSLILPPPRRSTASPVEDVRLRYGNASRTVRLDPNTMPYRMRRELPVAILHAPKVEEWVGFLIAAMLEGKI